MAGPPRRSEAIGSSGSPTLRQRLAESWAARRDYEFSVLVIDELLPKLRGYLRRKYTDLSLEDCDDCFSTALERFFDRDDRTIANPQSYIWTSTRNQACDLLEERQSLPTASDVTPEECSEEDTESSAEMAVMLLEALVDDVDAEPTWATRVVLLAAARLRPALQRVIQHLLINGPDYDATSAPEELGMSSQTFRANKSKAYSKLRELIPVIMEEYGIAPPSARVAKVFLEHYEFAANIINGEPDSE